jgi:hypothetical protein
MFFPSVNFGCKRVLSLLFILCSADVYAESLTDLLSKGKEGSVFVIKENYNLGGKKVTVPKNSTLRFEGGSIENGTLALDGCYIDGKASFDCSFEGDITNEFFDAAWISSGSDIGVKINYAQKYFKRLRTPYGEHRFSTPIKIEKATKVYLDGIFTYTGSITNNGSAIEIIKTVNCDIYLMALTIDRTTLDYSDSRNQNFIGLCLTSCNNILVYCQMISFFNENIRFQDLYGLGCSYNKVLCLQNNNANIGIRFYADDTYGKSWCNETSILGGRFTSYNYGVKYGTKYGIVVAGPAFDNDRYGKRGVTNYWDASSNISVRSASFEGLDVGIYARNVSGLNIWACREESVTTFVKVNGYIHHFTHDIGYKAGVYDLSESTDFSIREFNSDNAVTIPIKNYSPYPRSAFGNVFSSEKEVSQDIQTGDYLACTGVILKTMNNKQFEIVFQDRNSKPIEVAGGSIVCKYLTRDAKEIVNNMQTYSKPNPVAFFSKAYNLWAYSRVINVPDGIEYIFVGLANTGNEDVDNMVVWSLNPIDAITTEKSVMGPIDKKPASLPLGMSYFDTTNNRPIYWTGQKWVDANGKEL